MELKEALVQYCELREEIKDLRERIERDEIRLRRIEEEGVVSDTVRGTRKDGTIGPIKITGFPVPEYRKVKAMIKKRIAKLRIKEEELQEKSILVSTHGAAMTALLNRIKGNLSVAGFWRDEVPPNCAVTIVEVAEGTPVIKKEGVIYYKEKVKPWKAC